MALFKKFIMSTIIKGLKERGRLSKSFFKSLTEGPNSTLLQILVTDPELDVQIRDNYINVYYRGGNILRIKPDSYQFDKYYFYLKDYRAFPKTYIDKVAKSKTAKISPNSKEPIPTKEEAISIINQLDLKEKQLIELLPDKIREYLKIAKDTMDRWFTSWNKKERDDQHRIAISNREFSRYNDLVVVDIEFAVSTLQPYNNARNPITGKKKICRFDIIAVDRTGRIYVIELKQNGKADSKENKANVQIHTEDFNNTVGQDVSRLFATEICNIVKTKQELNILSNNISIDCAKKPIFAVTYSGSDSKEFNSKYESAGLKVIKIDAIDKNLYLKF